MTGSAIMAIINLSSMVVSGWTATTTLVSGVSTICPVSGRVLDAVGCCNLLGNNLLELL